MRPHLLAASAAAVLALSPSIARSQHPAHEPPEAMKRIVELPADNVRDALEHDTRPAADRSRDAGLKPEALLRAAAVARGMRVADLRAGDGWFAQILATAVRRNGRVWANNDPASLDTVTADAWKARLASAADIGRLDNPLSQPLAPWANRLQLAFSRGAYADAVARGIDRAAMHANVFANLAPGGRYVVVDALAAPGMSAADAARLCRVDEELVRREVEAAGFRFVSSGTELRDAADSRRDAACGADAAGRSTDRFLLVFEKTR